MKTIYKAAAVYSPAHFLMDFACAYLLFSPLHSSGRFYFLLLIYNFCAFALQMPLGLLADRLNKNAAVAAVGCGMAAAAFGCVGAPPAAVLLAGIGNALFHIGGGIDILNGSVEKAAALGVFVSPGAFGVYFGTILGKRGVLPETAVAAALLLTGAVILLTGCLPGRSLSDGNVPVSFAGTSREGITAGVACLFAVVCLRSYVGMTLTFPWKAQGQWGLALVSAVVLGKAAGGFLADRFGPVKASALSLGFAAVLFPLSGYPAAGVAAVLLFNMTMPVTLWAVARGMPGCRGFSFGLLTFGLFAGFAPVYLQLPAPFAAPLGFAGASVLSLVLLLPGLRKAAK